MQLEVQNRVIVVTRVNLEIDGNKCAFVTKFAVVSTE